MATAQSINISGTLGEKIKLSSDIFSIKTSPSLLAQSVRVYLSNQRSARARTKSRGEVSKTTAKMYRQKGTGRARHGAYSAPIFVGGGVAHGPRGNQNYHRTLSSKLNHQAILGGLSHQASLGRIFVLSEDEKTKVSVKSASKLVRQLIKSPKSLLSIFDKSEINLIRAFRNLPDVNIVYPQSLNLYTTLKHDAVMFSSKALDQLSKIL